MLADAWILTRREIRDSLRDWRITIPILILTLVFPWIMNLTTRVAVAFTERYQATIIPIRLIPFAIMIVGFFPISFSLIIALEAFVGEKERNSLEPLLTTPLSDESLYTGKLLASVLLPLAASFIGMGAYLIIVYFSMNYVPEPITLIQILLLTTMEALVMVAGAVVVSSHTTSVRAANLLASFIIVPMAFLIQAETIFLFWGQNDALWCTIAALAVADALLIRTGIRTFNREELLAHEIDELNLSATIRLFVKYLEVIPFSLARIYRRDLPRVLRENRASITLTLIVMIGALLMGWLFALEYPLPESVGGMFHVNADTFSSQVENPGFDFLPALSAPSIFNHNVRTLALSALLGMFSFGVLALVLLIPPMGIVGFIAEQALHLGYDPLTFLFAFILPHGIFEIPAAVLATAFSLKLGASFVAPPPNVTAGENFLHALADLVKIFVFLVVPLLLIAAWVEANVTPQVVLYLYGK
jgi:uncharacterized membrane protein SpoIIM required for sporulation